MSYFERQNKRDEIAKRLNCKPKRVKDIITLLVSERRMKKNTVVDESIFSIIKQYHENNMTYLLKLQKTIEEEYGVGYRTFFRCKKQLGIKEAYKDLSHTQRKMIVKLTAEKREWFSPSHFSKTYGVYWYTLKDILEENRSKLPTMREDYSIRREDLPKVQKLIRDYRNVILKKDILKILNITAQRYKFLYTFYNFKREVLRSGINGDELNGFTKYVEKYADVKTSRLKEKLIEDRIRPSVKNKKTK